MAGESRFRLHGLGQTARLAEALADTLRAGDCLLLEGPVGAGKTSFARALIRHFCGPDAEVPSPTFSLIQTYECGGQQIVHLDLFRLASGADLAELGLDSAFAGSITLAEWPDRAPDFFPARHLTVRIAPAADDETGRILTLLPAGDWPRLAGLKERIND